MPLNTPPPARAVDEAGLPLSITMIGALPPWRGVAPYTRHLVDALEQVSDVEVEFLDFRALYPARLYPGGDPVDPSAASTTFRHTRVRRLLAWYNPLSWIWAGLTLRGDVVHAQCWSYILAPVYLTVLGLARLRGKRVLLTLHNVLPHESSRWQHLLFRSVFRAANHFLVHSTRNVDALAAIHPASLGRTSIVPLGLHGVPMRRKPSQEEARRELRLPVAKPVILAFGNLRPYKGLDILLRAFRQVLDTGRDATLVVAGQPWGDMQPYQRLISDLDFGENVECRLEYVPEERVQAFFAAADLAVYPYTHFDAQSAAATLALSFGVPVVVSDVGGLPDLVDDPRAVVPPNDPKALAGAIETILGDAGLRAKLARDAAQRAKSLDWVPIAERTAELYRTMCELPRWTLTPTSTRRPR